MNSIELVLFLDKLGVPLYNNTKEGVFAKNVMLSPLGKTIRTALEKYKPVCTVFPHGIFILSDGSVTTCCYDPYGQNAFSSIYEFSIDKIWKEDIRRILERDLYDLACCRECIGSFRTSITSSRSDLTTWQNRVRHYPQEITIEIMGACNYGCCMAKDIYRYRKGRRIKPDLEKIFENLKQYLPHVERLRLFNYGEPLLHDGFQAFVIKCRSVSDKLVLSLATNGILLDEKFSKTFIDNRLNHIIVSVHGGPGTPNMLKYSRYGADYDKVLANVKRLLEMRNAARSEFPKVSLRAILFNWNDTDCEMDKLRVDAKSLGLSATNGSPDTDNYHWILDGGVGKGPLSSRRFTPGSHDLQKLIVDKEFFQ